MSCACILVVGQPFTIAWTPGDIASLRVQFLRADGITPFDLTDCVVACRVASDDTATATLLWDIGGDDTAIYDAAAGIALITPDSATSLLLEPSKTYPAVVTLSTSDGELLTFGPGYIQTTAVLPASAL